MLLENVGGAAKRKGAEVGGVSGLGCHASSPRFTLFASRWVMRLFNERPSRLARTTRCWYRPLGRRTRNWPGRVMLLLSLAGTRDGRT